MWLMFSFFVFSLAKSTAEQALAPLVLVAGWWGWASLVGATHATLNDSPWRMWVRLGLAVGAALIIAFIAFTVPGHFGYGDLAKALLPFVLFGGPCLVLAGTLTTRMFFRKRIREELDAV